MAVLRHTADYPAVPTAKSLFLIEKAAVGHFPANTSGQTGCFGPFNRIHSCLAKNHSNIPVLSGGQSAVIFSGRIRPE